MSGKLNTIENAWGSIKGGTFVNDYVSDQRTALQRAIDKNASSIRVERKKEVEDGDLRMFDGTGWVQFCIHRARKLINEDKIFVATQERVSGIWVNHSNEHVRILNDSLDESPEKGSLKDVYQDHLMSNDKGINFEEIKNHTLYGYESQSDWERKMMKQEREEKESSTQSNRRRFA